MSVQIKKIESSVAFPVTAQGNNQLYFTIPDEGSVVDLASSYIELELGVAGLVDNQGNATTNQRNLVLGHDGMFYQPSCLFRQSALTDNTHAKTLHDLNFVNVIDNNLKYFSAGANETVSDALWSGAGHRSPSGEIVSIFNNAYSDESAILKLPMSSIIPGSLGVSSAIPSADMTLRLLVEPQFKNLMRAVPAQVYEKGAYTEGVTGAFGNVGPAATACVASATGTIINFQVGDDVQISGIMQSAHEVFYRTIATVVADDGETAGNFTFTPALSASQALSQVTVTKVTNTYPLGCEGITTESTVLTLVNLPAIETSDVYKNSVLHVHYKERTASGLSVDKIHKCKVVDLQVYLGNLISITLDVALPVPVNGGSTAIFVVPLFANCDTASVQINNAHIVLYRHNVKAPKGQKMLKTCFESTNVQCVGGLQSFMYNFKLRSDCYNAIAITPTSSNLYGQQQTFETMLMTVDECNLSSIYIPVKDAVYIDNLAKCLSNSPEYPAVNLNDRRDIEVNSDIRPVLFTGKIKPSVFNGEAFITPGPDRNLRVELTAETEKTPLTQVFLFQEKWLEI
jgi:hypothetical protein